MKLIFLIDHLYLHGGAEKVLTNRVNYLAEMKNFDVTIVTTEQNGNPPCYQLSSKIKTIDLGINYHRQKSYFNPLNIYKIPRHFKKLNHVIKKISPSVIVVLNYSFEFYWLPYVFKKIPKIKEYHSSRFYHHEFIKNESLPKKIVNFFTVFIQKKYDKIIVLNPTEKNFYFNNNIEVIPNPIALSCKLTNINAKQVIAAGRIAPIKGFEKLIDAWEIVNKEFPDWNLNIYGQGEVSYISQIQSLINERNLEKSIILQPPTFDLIDKMIQHSIFVMSSVSECFPMVLLEALSVGLPIISFDCPTGPKNIITPNEDGILVENQNSAAMAEKIIFLINQQIIRREMSEQGKKNVNRFSEERIMKKWIDLLVDITSKK